MHLQLLVSVMKGISSLSFDKSLLDLCGFTVSTFFAVVLLCNLYYDWHWEALFLNSVYSYSDVLSLISYGIYSMSRPVYCTISTVSSRILKICWPRWPINFLLSSSDLKQGLFSWPLRVTELTVEMVQYTQPFCTVGKTIFSWATFGLIIHTHRFLGRWYYRSLVILCCCLSSPTDLLTCQFG